jgi:hypothetical protein
MLRIQISDFFSRRSAKVDEDNALLVKAIPIPTVSTRDDQIPFAQLFSSNGLITGSTNMNVNGSVTPQEFSIVSAQTGDRYITSLAFTIADNSSGSVTLNVFAGLAAALTNGVKIYYETEKGRIPFQQGAGLKTNFEFIRLSLGNPAFGTGNDAFKVGSISGTGVNTLHGYFPVLDVRRAFGFQWGIRLRQSADQKIIIQVNDDLSQVGEFTAFATGFDLAQI